MRGQSEKAGLVEFRMDSSRNATIAKVARRTSSGGYSLPMPSFSAARSALCICTRKACASLMTWRLPRSRTITVRRFWYTIARLSRRRFPGCSAALMLVAPNMVAPMGVLSRVQNYQQLDFRVRKFAWNVHPNTPCLHDLFPSGTSAADSEVLTLDFRRDCRRRHRQVRERQSRQGRFHHLGKQLTRTNFDQALGARD